MRFKSLSELRGVLESFTYGFPVVTVKDEMTSFMGTLATSFHTLEDDSIQVVCSLGRYIGNFPAYQRSNFFGVNLLSAKQASLAQHFNDRPVEIFEGVDCEMGISNTPMLRGCAIRLECRTKYFYESGGEFVFIGQLLQCDCSGLPYLRTSKSCPVSES